jgi:hypothetical protein
MTRDEWRAKGEGFLQQGQLRRALGAFRRAAELDTRGDQSLALFQLIDAATQVLSQRGQYFLHPSDETLRSRWLEAGAPALARPELRALANEVAAFGFPELVACLRAQTLRAGLAGQDLLVGLPEELGPRVRDAILWLYEELLKNEE